MSASDGTGPAARPETAATAARGAARLVGPVLAALLAALPATWWLPLFTARVPFLWREDISIASGLVQLWRLDRLLFLVVLVFSVLAPLAKLGASLYVWHRVPLVRAGHALERLTLLGKLSMAELFLLAVVIVGFKGVGIGKIEIAWGLHAFAAVVLASFAASLWAEAALAAAAARPAAGPARNNGGGGTFVTPGGAADLARDGRRAGEEVP